MLIYHVAYQLNIYFWVTIKLMSNNSFQGKFLEDAEAIVLNNIAEEQFGVSELASHMNMSRSSLLRKIKKQADLSASQFIRQIRLQKGLELLTDTELTISEISYEVGFGNSSYFIKCFREQYGYPPGEVRKQGVEGIVTREVEKKETVEIKEEEQISSSYSYRWPIIGVAVVILGLLAFIQMNKSSTSIETKSIKKSIAVLPFKNMSSDSTNLYFVNGLMESSLNNLQKIEALRVVSRTSVEKYRNTKLTTAEISDDLNVNYLVEGSGQRVGDQVLLNIQLIEVINDTPIWAEQYSHEVVDIFSLQNEVAKKIADAIEAKVTPAELEQIEKIPTDNILAYDFYLQALEYFNQETKEGLEESIPLFEKSIENDPQFALAYSQIAIAYYYLDLHQAEKQHTETINNYADKALLYDSKSSQSLIAKALYYINIHDFKLAVPHLEKALEYNPNSAPVVQILSNLYSQAIPNTSKYLKYALKGVQLDIAANDSIAKSFIYLQLSNALIQTGFAEEASQYINLAIGYYPENQYGPILSIFIQYALDQDMDITKRRLVKEWERDTTRLDILQEVAKFYYFEEQYDTAYYYYKKYIKVKSENNLNLYPQENLKIGIVYEKMGFVDEANEFYEAYTHYCENDESIYQSASMAWKYVHEGNNDLAIEQLKEFATKNNYQYWLLLFFEKDPLIESLKQHPEYDTIIKKIENRFWNDHEILKQSLSELDLI